ncbi:MAG: hypothetical protein OCC46_06730 [Pseudodesulfovibrio sp.]
MNIPVCELVLENYDDVKLKLMPLLRRRIFHSTTEEGYRGMLEAGAVLSARDSEVKRQWPDAPSLFFERGCVSFWDYYHPKQSHIDENIDKQTFYRHGSEHTTCLLMLKDDFFSKLITWEEFSFDDWRGKQIVPHIESGLKSPVPLSMFDGIIKISLWEDRPRYETLSEEEARSALELINERRENRVHNQSLEL